MPTPDENPYEAYRVSPASTPVTEVAWNDEVVRSPETEKQLKKLIETRAAIISLGVAQVLTSVVLFAMGIVGVYNLAHVGPAGSWPSLIPGAGPRLMAIICACGSALLGYGLIRTKPWAVREKRLLCAAQAVTFGIAVAYLIQEQYVVFILIAAGAMAWVSLDMFTQKYLKACEPRIAEAAALKATSYRAKIILYCPALALYAVIDTAFVYVLASVVFLS